MKFKNLIFFFLPKQPLNAKLNRLSKNQMITPDKIMNLVKVYPEIKKSIVAFIPKFSFLPDSKKPKLPPILGTGFFINDKGLIATNDHVAKSF